MGQGWVYEDDLVGWRTIQDTDLPASGVTAATYGDATHVSQVTVNAEGVVTGASSVAISGLGAGVGDITSSGGTITVTNPTGPTTNVDLPTTGVAAGSYGDSTHVGAFTVNAEGVLTAASSVALGALAGTGLTLLYGSVLSSPGLFDTGAGGIASGHQNLIVIGNLQLSSAVTSGAIWGRVNNDATGNYDQMFAFWAPAGTSSNNTAQSQWTFAGLAAGASQSQHYSASFVMEIPAYDNAVFAKAGLARVIHPIERIVFCGIGWRGTAAISRFALGGGTPGSPVNFSTGSSLYVYGTQ